MDQAANQQTAGQDARGGKPSSVLPGRAFGGDAWLVATAMQASDAHGLLAAVPIVLWDARSAGHGSCRLPVAAGHAGSDGRAPDLVCCPECSAVDFDALLDSKRRSR